MPFSPALYLFEELATRTDITIITNGVFGMERMLSLDLSVISTGGELNPQNRGVLVGSLAEHTVDRLFADIFFFSTQTISDEGRISDVHLSEISVRAHMLAHSAKSVFLCDSSKLGRQAPHFLTDLSNINTMICDTIPESLMGALSQR